MTKLFSQLKIKVIKQKQLALAEGAKSGFTLIEILVVIGLIAILAAVVIIAINPARQFAQGHNSARTSNVETILNAVGQSLADNKGALTGCLANIPVVNPVPNPLTSTTGRTIAVANTGVSGVVAACTAANCIDLSCVTPTYIPALPADPSAIGAHWTSVTDYDTSYNIFQDSTGRITVFAPKIETALNNAVIQVTR